MPEPQERRDDWRHGVDENLASLNTGQRQTDRTLDDMELTLAALDKSIRGDMESGTSGLVGRLESLETNVAKLMAIVIMDASGDKGLLHDVKELMERREDRRSAWGNWTKVIVAAIMSGFVTHFWSNIQEYFTTKSTDPVAQLIEKAKRPKTHSRHIVRDVDE